MIPPARRRWRNRALIAYGLSLLSKASGVTLPVVLLVLDVYPLRRLGGGPGRWLGPLARHVWWEKVPFFLLAAAAAVIAPLAQSDAGAVAALRIHGVARSVSAVPLRPSLLSLEDNPSHGSLSFL